MGNELMEKTIRLQDNFDGSKMIIWMLIKAMISTVS